MTVARARRRAVASTGKARPSAGSPFRPDGRRAVRVPSLTAKQQALVVEHLANALTTAKRMFRAYRGAIEMEDCYSAACEGLVAAARTYDASKGTSFKTHAFGSMQFYVMTWAYRLGRQTGWSYSATKAEMSKGYRGRVQRVQFVPWPTATDDGLRFDPADHRVPDPDEAIEREQKRAFVLSAAQSPRERAIVSGLFDGRTLSEIGMAVGLSAERVRTVRDEIIERAKQQLADLRRAPG